MSNVVDQAEQLVATLADYGSCLVAFSGGVDSAVVAKAAQLALGNRAVAVTGIGPAVADEELQVARRVAAAIGIEHRELATAEMHQLGYVANCAGSLLSLQDGALRCTSRLRRSSTTTPTLLTARWSTIWETIAPD